MSNELQVFMFEDRDVRTVMVEGEPWFVAKDVCDILGYQNASKAIADHVREDDKLNNTALSSLGQRGGWVINESGLYSLVMGSHMPEAQEFKYWITSEVIPSLRKHGGYIVGQEDMAPDLLLSKALLYAQSKIEAMEKQIEEDKPKIEGFDALMASEGSLTITNAAKHFGLNPKIEVFAFLRNKGYLCRYDLPTQKAIDEDILILRESRDALGVMHQQARVPVSSLPIWHRRLVPRIRAWVGMYSIEE